MRRLCLPLLFVVSASAAFPQAVVSTVAGTDWVFPGNGKKAVGAPLGNTLGIVVDKNGNAVFASAADHVVLRLEPDGMLTVLAGNGLPGYSGEGDLAVNASLNFPTSVTYDAAGNLYIADFNNNRVRKVGLDGRISTYAGTGVPGYTGDGGPATAAAMKPRVVLTDGRGNLLISDLATRRIRRIDGTGTISTLAGNGRPDTVAAGNTTAPVCSAGTATSTSLGFIEGLALDSRQNLYLADFDSNCVRRLSPDGVLSRVAGSAVSRFGFSPDGTLATDSLLWGPTAVGVDGDGNLLIADANNFVVRRVDGTGRIQTILGRPRGSSGAVFLIPWSLALDSGGRSGYIGFDPNRIVQRFSFANDGTAALTQVAGGGIYRAVAAGTPSGQAYMSTPRGLAIDAGQNVYVADSQNYRVLRLGADGKASVFAGDGTNTIGDYPKPAAQTGIGVPEAVAVDRRSGTVYIANARDHFVVKVTRDGTMSLFAGNYQRGAGDENVLATQTPLSEPRSLAVDDQGNVYIGQGCDPCTGGSYQRIRRVTTDGLIATYSGTGEAGFGGDGGNLRQAIYDYPGSLAIDGSGNLYVADTKNNRIRRIDVTGVIRTVAGGGTRVGRDADGFPGTQAVLSAPAGVVADGNGGIYFSEAAGNRLRRLGPDGLLSTVAGTGDRGFSGDGGLALNARLAIPVGLAVDSAGNLLFADSGNNRIREVLGAPPLFDVTTTTLSISGVSGGVEAASQTVGLNSTLVGLAYTVSVDGADWLRVTPASGGMPSTLKVVADPSALSSGSYQGSISVRAPGAKVPLRTVLVNLDVAEAVPPRLNVDKISLDFSTPRGGSPSGALTVSNLGTGQLTFAIANASSSGWLDLTVSSLTATPQSPARVDVKVKSGDLKPGTYRTKLVVTGSPDGSTVEVPVTLSVTENRPQMLLAQSGLRFRAIAGGGAPLPQRFGVLNSGTGTLDFTVEASTLGGGDGWLAATVAGSGTVRGTVASGADTAATVVVSVNPAGLGAGDYYGWVRLNGGAVNAPQTVPVRLTVLDGGSSPGPEVSQASVLFSSVPGVNPGSQTVLIANLGSKPLGYVSARPGSDTWVTAAPGSGTIQPGEYGRLVIQPDYSGLLAGVAQTRVTLQFSDDSVRTIDVVALVGLGAADEAKGAGRAAACAQQTLRPQYISPADQFPAALNAPTPLRLKVFDNCNTQIFDPALHVTAAVLDGNNNAYGPDVTFQYVGGGEWQATFTPSVFALKVTLRTIAVRSASPLVGRTDLVLVLVPEGTTVPPVVKRGAMQNAATLENTNLVAPGGLLAIFGSGLSDSVNKANGLPLDYQSDGTEVYLQGRRLALLYTSDGQINAQVPYDLTPNSPQQLLVRRKDTLMMDPVSMNVALAQPGILAVNQAGTGQGFIYVVKSDGSRVLADAAAPASAGDRIVILAAGLGVTAPDVAAGQKAPDDPRANVLNSVSVTIGGVPAAVEGAFLRPDVDLPGRYEVVCRMPAGVSPGSQVPVILFAADQISPPTVTMAVH